MQILAGSMGSCLLFLLVWLHHATLAKLQSAPDAFEQLSAYQNLSHKLSGCGQTQKNSVESLACSLGCKAHETVLHEAFRPWWDNRVHGKVMRDGCREQSSNTYLGAIAHKAVYFLCCRGSSGCEPPQKMLLKSGKPVTYLQMLLSLITEIAAEVELPDMYFSFNIGDYPVTDKVYWSPFPMLHWARSGGHWTIPIPNPHHLAAHIEGRLGNNAAHLQHHVPWSMKIPKLFWRGSLSLPRDFIPGGLKGVPRIRLQSFARQHPTLFDIAFTHIDPEIYTQLSADEAIVVKQKLIKGEPVDMQATLPKYKYVIDIAGVMASGQLVELLASGSVLLLPENFNNELIYDWLVPWEHFVPLNSALSDLVPALQWLETHQEVAQAIAARGFQFFTEQVRQQDTHCYLLQTLLALNQTVLPDKLPSDTQLQNKGWQKIQPNAKLVSLPNYVPLKH